MKKRVMEKKCLSSNPQRKEKQRPNTLTGIKDNVSSLHQPFTPKCRIYCKISNSHELNKEFYFLIGPPNSSRPAPLNPPLPTTVGMHSSVVGLLLYKWCSPWPQTAAALHTFCSWGLSRWPSSFVVT